MTFTDGNYTASDASDMYAYVKIPIVTPIGGTVPRTYYYAANKEGASDLYFRAVTGWI